MRGALQDFRYSLKGLVKTPLFAAVAVLTFALGIGATTTVFSLVKGVLLNPLPYREPGRLALLWETSERMQSMLGFREIPVSPAMALTWRKQAQSFESVGFFRSGQSNLTGGGETERLRGGFVSSDVFRVLGIQPVLGRTFTADEETPGRDAVVVLSYSLWRSRFNADPAIVGRTIGMDDKPVTVIGVMPHGFAFPRGNEHRHDRRGITDSTFWRPMAIAADQANNFGNHFMGVVARLKPGVEFPQAQAEMAAIESQVLGQVDASAAKEFSATVIPYLENMVKETRPVLLMLAVAVAFVLLVACVNLAGLLVVRMVGQRKEMAVRAALGASPLQLGRHVVFDSVIVGLAGCALGSLVAVWGVSALRQVASSRIPRLEGISVDGTVLAFSVAISIGAALLFGLVPALRTARVDLAEALKSGGRTGSASGHHRLRTGLVAVEVALSMVLLTGAGLLARSFWQVLNAERGFDVNNVLTMQLPLPNYRYPKLEQRQAFMKQLEANVGSLAEVESVGLVQQLPLTGEANIHAITLEGRPTKSGEEPIAEMRYVSSGYFDAIRLPLKQGRLITPADNQTAPEVAVVNESLAKRFWPGEDPIGKRFRRGQRPNLPWITVAGVVADARHAGLDRDPRPQAYLSYEQDDFRDMAVVVRTRSDPRQLMAAVRNEVRRLDAEQPVLQMRTLTDLMDATMTDRRLQTSVLGAFAIFALLLATIGLNGVIAYSATQRMREFAIRIALGAERRDILRGILTEGLKVSAIGLTAGLVCSMGLSRLLEGLLYQVKPADWITLVTVSVLLLACCLAASLQPARRAMRVDPIMTLKDA